MFDSLKRALGGVFGRGAPAEDAAAAAEPRLVAELALWSATADGALDPAELDELVAMLRLLPGLEAFDADAATRMVDAMAAAYATEDAISTRVTELASAIRGRDARRASYQLALWSAARDGHFSEDEVAFLEALQDLLEIGDDEAEALLRATVDT